MSGEFGAEYWEQVWNGGHGIANMAAAPPHPRILSETAGLTPGSALDVGCGAGAEALALAQAGWQVTGVDVSAQALAHAAERAQAAGVQERTTWTEADATTWEPPQQYDLVLSCYAHAPIPQVELYERLSQWVAPGARMLLIGHLHHHGDRPQEASTTAAQAAERFSPEEWEVITSQEGSRVLPRTEGAAVPLRDVILHLRRRSGG